MNWSSSAREIQEDQGEQGTLAVEAPLEPANSTLLQAREVSESHDEPLARATHGEARMVLCQHAHLRQEQNTVVAVRYVVFDRCGIETKEEIVCATGFL